MTRGSAGGGARSGRRVLPTPRGGPDAPLYRQIEQDLATQIRRRELAVGSLVPSERQICERYGVSPITARRALLELTKQGLVYRQAGIGSFVADEEGSLEATLVFVGFDADRWRTSAGAMGELVGGVSEAAWRHDCSLHLLRVDGPVGGAALARLAESGGRGRHGLLLRVAGGVSRQDLEALDTRGVPYVLIRRYLQNVPVNCVVPADEAGVRLAVSHLARIGHRRIALISALPEMVLTQDRHRGYVAAVAANALDDDPRLLQLADRYAPDAGHEAASLVLSLTPRPTAVIVDADMAAGVYRAAADRRLEVPRDLAVVGYDEVPEARSLVPSLTCVRTSHYETGKVAAEALLDLMAGGQHQPQRLVIEPQLVVRDSCGGRDAGPAGTHASTAAVSAARPMPRVLPGSPSDPVSHVGAPATA